PRARARGAAPPRGGFPPAPLPSPQQLQQQAEKAVQDLAGQVDAAARSLFAPFAPPAPPAQPQV
ncbi:hypothetical protein, partial [Dietzia massiliensis]|uniref:hypothetical protein n=1 Tax=Dietzia massiliensis TaxID=2697499 RepID=UPI001BD07DC0